MGWSIVGPKYLRCPIGVFRIPALKSGTVGTQNKGQFIFKQMGQIWETWKFPYLPFLQLMLNKGCMELPAGTKFPYLKYNCKSENGSKALYEIAYVFYLQLCLLPQIIFTSIELKNDFAPRIFCIFCLKPLSATGLAYPKTTFLALKFRTFWRYFQIIS